MPVTLPHIQLVEPFLFHWLWQWFTFYNQKWRRGF